jgi:hypothetical protein
MLKKNSSENLSIDSVVMGHTQIVDLVVSWIWYFRKESRLKTTAVPTGLNNVWSMRILYRLIRKLWYLVLTWLKIFFEYKWSITVKYNTFMFVIECNMFRFSATSSDIILQNLRNRNWTTNQNIECWFHASYHKNLNRKLNNHSVLYGNKTWFSVMLRTSDVF